MIAPQGGLGEKGMLIFREEVVLSGKGRDDSNRERGRERERRDRVGAGNAFRIDYALSLSIRKFHLLFV